MSSFSCLFVCLSVGFDFDVGDEGPHACASGSLPTEPSLSPAEFCDFILVLPLTSPKTFASVKHHLLLFDFVRFGI